MADTKSKLLTGAAMTALLSGSALAADISYPPPVAHPAPTHTLHTTVMVAPSWSGAYIGVYLGGAWGTDAMSANKYSKGAIKCTKASHCFSTNLSMDGFFGGAAIGYNHQATQNLVVGVEADIQYGDVSGSWKQGGLIYSSGGNKAFDRRASAEIDLSGTLRGRIGFVPGHSNNTLLYATAGLAWATYTAKFRQDKYTGCSSFDCDQNDFKDSKKGASAETGLIGYAAGLGVEHRFSGGPWSAKAEYLYTSYHAEVFTGEKLRFRNAIDNHSLRVGMNYAILQ